MTENTEILDARQLSFVQNETVRKGARSGAKRTSVMVEFATFVTLLCLLDEYEQSKLVYQYVTKPIALPDGLFCCSTVGVLSISCAYCGLFPLPPETSIRELLSSSFEAALPS